MKKILSALVLISCLAVLAVPMVTSAQPDEPEEMTGECTMRHDFSLWEKIDCAAEDDACEFDDPELDCGVCCLLDTIYSVTDWIFVFVLALVVIFVLMGAFNLLTAAGSPEKVKTGRDLIVYAIIGAVVAALAKSIPAIVISILRLG